MKNTTVGTVVAVVAVALVVTLFTGGVAFAGSEIDEKARLELTSTGNFRHFEGDAKLQLQMKDQDETRFRAKTTVEEGAIEHIVYSMWLANQEGNTILLDTDVAEERCAFDPVDHSVECDVIASLSADLGHAPFNITTLGGLTVNIREHFGGHAQVVLSGTVTEPDLD